MPQFIETESKIIGPFTFRQFAYLAAGGVVIFILRYVLTSFFWFMAISVFVALAGVAFAFYRVDGMPLVQYFGSAISFAFGPKKYIFKKEGEDFLPSSSLKEE